MSGVAAEQTRVGSGAGVSKGGARLIEGGARVSEGGARLSEATARLSEERSRRRRLRRPRVYSGDDTNMQVQRDGRSPVHSRSTALGCSLGGERLGDGRPREAGVGVVGVDCNEDACFEVGRSAGEGGGSPSSSRKRMRLSAIATPVTAEREEVRMNEPCCSDRQPFQPGTSLQRGSSRADTIKFPARLAVRPCFITHPQLHPSVPIGREGQALGSQYVRGAAAALEGDCTHGGSWGEEDQGDIMLSQ